MDGGRWRPPPAEQAIGLGFYASRTPPIAAILKERPEDFRVREISSYPTPDPNGAYTVLRVVSRNWEQHELGQRLAQRLGLGPQSIAWAGTKDRRAVTERLASYRGLPPTEAIALPQAEIVEVYRARDGLVLGHHYGNSFTVHLSGVSDADAARGTLQEARADLERFGGFPNFFGPQRFGEVRPITHEVGRALVRHDPAAAVDLYLTATPPGSPGGLGNEARRAFAEHRDPARALREFPPQFRFERQLLDHLARGQSAVRALRALSRELRTLFIHAYQALLFNRWMTLRFERGLSLVRPEPGDFLLRVARDGTIPGTHAIPVGSDNLEEAARLAASGRARLSGPLVGFATPPLGGRPGALLDEILAAEGITRGSFETPATPEIASAGTWRPTVVPLPPIGTPRGEGGAEGEPSAQGPDELWLTFSLPKGAYATTLLREFLKPGATPEPVEPTGAVPSNRAY